ncbi:MAG: hypothetical protein WKF66_17250 [Pedobacter sp.]
MRNQRKIKDTKYWMNFLDEKQILWDTLFYKKRWPLYFAILLAVIVLKYIV